MSIAVDAPVVRVAAYARISVADRDSTPFSSIQAQVEAVTAYIQSHRSEGWALAKDPFVDDGFSGGNADRPALRELLNDAAKGEFDLLVVHRFDRFSRSQRDFLNLLHDLEQNGVAFASVSQQLDTSTSMGRCMLSVMTAFAQMEREVIVERTRSKIQAARRKGLWTGGRPVLGFDVVEKRLEINPPEAIQVREVFDLYLELGGILAVVRELNARERQTKSWKNQRGKQVTGGSFTKTVVHSILTNPLYVGRIRAGEEVVDGAQRPIVAEATWEDVQTLLAENRNDDRRPRKRRGDALLQGLARCSCGAAMTPTFTTKGNRRYAYYVCSRRQKSGAESCPGSRIAAGEFEAFVVDRIRAIGRDPMLFKAVLEADQRERDEFDSHARRVDADRTQLLDERTRLVDAIAQGTSGNGTLADRVGEINSEIESLVQPEMPEPLDTDSLRAALIEFDGIWNQLVAAERARAIALLIEEIRFDASEGEIEITFRPGASLA